MMNKNNRTVVQKQQQQQSVGATNTITTRTTTASSANNDENNNNEDDNDKNDNIVIRLSKITLQQSQVLKKKVPWFMTHKEVCWKRFTIMASIEDLFYENPELCYTNEELPSYNNNRNKNQPPLIIYHQQQDTDSMMIPRQQQQQHDNKNSMSSSEINEMSVDVNEIVDYYYHHQEQQRLQQCSKTPTNTTLIHNPNTPGGSLLPFSSPTSSWIYSTTSSVVSTSFHYLIKKPITCAVDSMIGKTDYDTDDDANNENHNEQQHDSSVLAEKKMQQGGYTTNQFTTPNKQQQQQQKQYTSSASHTYSKSNVLVDDHESIICLEIIVQVIQYFYECIVHTTPIILSNRNELMDWIRTNLVPRTVNNNSNPYDPKNDIGQFIVNLNDKDLHVVLLCLQEISSRQQKLEGILNKFVFQSMERTKYSGITTTDNTSNTIWILGYDPIHVSIDVRVALHDIYQAQSMIEKNIVNWEEKYDQCTKDAIQYKKMNNNNTTTTQKQALFALKRRAMYSTKIESGRTLLLHLQQQQHSLETSVHDHMLIKTMEQTTQTLRNIRQGILFLDDNNDNNSNKNNREQVTSLSKITSSNNDVIINHIDNTVLDYEEELDHMTQINDTLYNETTQNLVVVVADSVVQYKNDDNNNNDTDIEEDADTLLLKELQDLTITGTVGKSTKQHQKNVVQEGEVKNQSVVTTRSSQKSTTGSSSSTTKKRYAAVPST